MSDPRPTQPQGDPGGGSPGPGYSQQPGFPQQPGVPQQPGGGPGYGRPPDTPQQPSEPKHPISVGQILGGIMFVLVIIFIAENTKSVDIRIIGPVVHAPLFVAILIAAVLGALTAWLLRYRRARGARRKQQARQYRSSQ